MINLIKADFYKLFRTKSFYINAILAILMCVSGVCIVYFTTQSLPSPYLGLNGVKAMTYAMMFMSSSNLLSLFCTIFLAIFIPNEFSFGTVKNILSSGQSRVSTYLSKLLIALFVVFTYTTLCSIISLVVGSIFWGVGDVSRNEYLDIFRMIGLNIVVEFAMQCIFTMICFLVKRNGMSIATNLIILMCTGRVIAPFINGLVEKFIRITNFDFNKYWPQTYAYMFSLLNIQSEDIIMGLTVCGVAILVSSLVGILIFTNSDID